jgi:uncharacterized protein YycO
MKTGDVVFVNDSGLLPDIIRFFDKGKFDHVAFCISSDHVIEAIPSGVSVNKFHYKNYEIISTNPTEEQLPIIAELVKKFTGKPYDFKEIGRLAIELEFGVHWLDRFNTDNEVICSELVGYFLVALGKASKSVINMSPNQEYAYMKSK